MGDVDTGSRAQVGAERLTSIDRALLHGVGEEGVVAANGRDAFYQTLRSGHPAKLARLGLMSRLGQVAIASLQASKTRCAEWTSAATSSAPCGAILPPTRRNHL